MIVNPGIRRFIKKPFSHPDLDAYVQGKWWFNGNGNDEKGVNNLADAGAVSYTTGVAGQAVVCTTATNAFLKKDTSVTGLGGSTQMTLAARFKRNIAGVNNCIFLCGDAALYKYFILEFIADTLRCDIGNDANNAFRSFSSTAAYADTTSWHTVVVNYDSGTFTVYYDGASVAGTTTGSWTGACVSPTTYLRIGSVSGSTVGSPITVDSLVILGGVIATPSDVAYLFG